MLLLNDVYKHLFDDIGRISGFPEIRGSAYEGLEWALTKAPLIDKTVLSVVEGHESIEVLFPIVPSYLDRLVNNCIFGGAHSRAHHYKLLRQLLQFGYKANYAYTRTQEEEAFARFRRSNAACHDWKLPSDPLTRAIIERAAKHVQRTCYGFEYRKVTPFHGPGAVYNSTCDKHVLSTWYSKLEETFPYYKYMLSSAIEQQDLIEDTYCENVADSIPCRSVCVPKDARGPRLICIHPAEAVWIQQGVRRLLETLIDTRIPRGMGGIKFEDQSINADLALHSSSTRQMATIDLSDASDRIPDRLVRVLFGERNYKRLGSCRADTVELGNNPAECIHMYAPMGNATTFPVESLIFWALCIASQELTMKGSKPFCSVFGDDIVVPAQALEACTETLSNCNLVVNDRKTFSKGGFRESCGTDAYLGFVVTPVRWKQSCTIPWRVSADVLEAVSATAGMLYRNGYMNAAYVVYQHIDARLRSIRRSFYIRKTKDWRIGGIVQFTNNSYSAQRDLKWDRDLCYWSVREFGATSSKERSKHVRGHVVASLSSLERTGLGCDPASRPSRSVRLASRWRPVA